MTQFAQAIQTQQCPEWCWAASISMIFGFFGHPVPQQQIVQQTYGAVVCLPSGSTFTIGADLSRSYIDSNNRRFTSQVTAAFDPLNGINNLSNAMIVNELRQNRPLLYCNTHHAEVLYSVSYSGPESAPTIVAANVIDPWPFNQRLHALTPSELTPTPFGEATFLAAVRVF